MSNSSRSSTASTEDVDGEFKPWRCGEEFQHPLPESSDPDEPWKTVVDHLMEKERGRCEAWKDEVDKLLVFAGLFSAVITGLLVESYKSLSEDPVQALLTQLVAQGANQTVAVAPGTAGRFSASESSKRVNTLWFLSLVLSLATALLGIVAQQWLREYARSSPKNTPLRQLPALLHMQAEAFDRFLVPQIFTTLPLMLIVSVVLFLIGMVDFLWALNHQVAIPVSISVLFVFVFLLFTTVYPSLQSLPDLNPSSRRSPTPRAPCPYKSPQSWAFYRLALLVKWVGHSILAKLIGFDHGSHLRYTLHKIKQLQVGWSGQAILWLRQRDLDLLSISKHEGTSFLSTSIRRAPSGTCGIYDTVRSLRATHRELSSEQSNKLYHAYHCFLELTKGEKFFAQDTAGFHLPDLHNLRNEYIFVLVLNQDFDRLPGPLSHDCDPLFLLDHLRIRFLFNENTILPSLLAHSSELMVRVLRWPQEHISHEITTPIIDDFHLNLMNIVYTGIELRRLAPDTRMAVQTQLRHHCIDLFEEASRCRPDEDEIGKTLWTTSYLSSGLEMSRNFMDSANFLELKQILLLKFIEFFGQQTAGCEYLLVAATIFMKPPVYSQNNFTKEDEDRVFPLLHAYHKNCNRFYAFKLLASICPDHRGWPDYVVDRIFSKPDRQRASGSWTHRRS